MTGRGLSSDRDVVNIFDVEVVGEIDGAADVKDDRPRACWEVGVVQSVAERAGGGWMYDRACRQEKEPRSVPKLA